MKIHVNVEVKIGEAKVELTSKQLQTIEKDVLLLLEGGETEVPKPVRTPRKNTSRKIWSKSEIAQLEPLVLLKGKAISVATKQVVKSTGRTKSSVLQKLYAVRKMNGISPRQNKKQVPVKSADTLSYQFTGVRRY